MSLSEESLDLFLCTDQFEEALTAAAAKVEAAMIKLVLALEEVPEIVRWRNIHSK